MTRYFARTEKNIVVEVITAESLEWCIQKFGGEWKETFRDSEEVSFAGAGAVFSPENQDFIPEKPFPSWNLNNEELAWEPATESKLDPETDLSGWREETREWVKTGEVVEIIPEEIPPTKEVVPVEDLVIPPEEIPTVE